MENVFKELFIEQFETQKQEYQEVITKCLNNATILTLQIKEKQCFENLFNRIISYDRYSPIVRSCKPNQYQLIEGLSNILRITREEIKRDINNFEIWKIICYCYLMLGDFPKSFLIASNIHKYLRYNDDIIFIYVSGVLYAHFKRYDKALSYFELLSDKQFEFIDDVNFRLGIIYRHLEKYGLSVKSFLKVNPLRLNLIKEDILLQLAMSYQLNGVYAQAEACYSIVFDIYPNIEVIRQLALFYYFYNRDINKTKNMNYNFLKRYKTDPILNIIAGFIELKLKNMQAAFMYYSLCINYFSDEPLYWFGFGIIYFYNQQFKDSVIAFQKALYIKNDIPQAWLNIGFISEVKNDTRNAIQAYNIGMKRCKGENLSEFKKRIRMIKNNDCSRQYGITDVDYKSFLKTVSERFAHEYLTAVPRLPYNPFHLCEEMKNIFSNLSSLPNSIFF